VEAAGKPLRQLSVVQQPLQRCASALAERRLLAGKRPLAGHDLSDFGLLGHLERVVHLNPEVTHCTFKFRVAQE
jgi:hypothetical protein